MKEFKNVMQSLIVSDQNHGQPSGYPGSTKTASGKKKFTFDQGEIGEDLKKSFELPDELVA